MLAEHGMSVAITSRTEADVNETTALVRAAGGTALGLPGDVTVGSEVRTLVNRVDEELGPPALLINNAGGSRVIGPLWNNPIDHWWSDIELNFKAAVLCTAAVLPTMMATGSGRIINISSGAGLKPLPAILPYSCAKAALGAFTEGLGGSLSDTAISVFALTPGLVATPGAVKSVFSDLGRQWMPEVVAAINADAAIPPEICAAAVIRFASGEFDALSGRTFDARDDFDAVADEISEIVSGDRRVLRLVP